MPSTNNNPIEATAVHAHIQGRITILSANNEVEKEYPIAAFRSTFMLNSIPTAQVAIPVGRSSVDSGSSDVIKARELSEQLKQFKTAHVYLNIWGEFTPDARWPQGDIRVFNGYVTGTSLTRSVGAISVLVQLTHWIMDLDASSALSSELTKGTPIGLQLPPISSDFSATISDPSDPMFKNAADDFWRASLKPKFIELMEGGSLVKFLTCVPKDATKLNQPEKLRNDVALPRLGDSAIGRFDDDTKIDVPVCKMATQLDLAAEGSISRHLTSTIFNGSAGYSSVFDKLMQALHLFQLTLVVNVDSAAVVPMSPCMYGTDMPRHVTVMASEYHAFAPSEPTFRVWRGVSISGHFTSEFGGYVPTMEQEEDHVVDSSGCYIADSDEELPQEYRDRSKLGTITFFPAPQWIVDDSMTFALTLPDTMPLGTPGVNHTMEDDEDEAIQTPPEVPVADTGNEKTRDPNIAKTLGDKYAKWWYWVNQFLSRTGELTGKLRLDIAPGSIVRIEDLEGKLYDSPAEFGYMYALVTAVRVNVDASEGHASTSLSLSHIRRESEKLYGTERHPLYTERWVGTVLQDVVMQSNSSKKTVASTFIPRPSSHELA